MGAAPSNTVLEELHELYRSALVLLAGADHGFVAEMPLPVLSGMYGAALRRAVVQLTYWPTMRAGIGAMLHPVPLTSPVAALFEQLSPRVAAHERAFKDRLLTGVMSDAAVHVQGLPYNRAVLHLAFRVGSTPGWSPVNGNLMLIRDAVQLLSFIEMMAASHGAGIDKQLEGSATPADRVRLGAYIGLLADVRELTTKLPLVEVALDGIHWVRDNMTRRTIKQQLDIDGAIHQIG